MKSLESLNLNIFKKLLKISVFALVSLSLYSCAMINKLGTNTVSNILVIGSDEVLTETNWHLFRAAAPANLKLIEGLWFTEKSNQNLLGILIKGYGAYGFSVNETIALKDIILDETEESYGVEQTILSYEKAIFYGFKYLAEHGISKQEFQDKSFSERLKSRFNDSFNKEDLVPIFYFAQAMGSSINLQRQNVQKMRYLTQVKTMLDWVCKKDPSLERGSCGLFEAVISASTPTLLGGSQAKAKKLFEKVIKKQPYNLLARFSYIQYHIIPMGEESEYSVAMESLKRDLNIWYRYALGTRNKQTKQFENNREFNLYNSIAREKFQTVSKLRSELF